MVNLTLPIASSSEAKIEKLGKVFGHYGMSEINLLG